MNFVETPPQFPGGAAALLKFLSENLKYPPLAKENGIEGRVILNFIVEKDGSLSDVRIVRDIGGGCGKEAVRLVQAMPKYLPGKQNGQAVRVKYTLPVAFKLN
jgi:protein TonB